jgi:hypothetical protein
MGSMAVGGGADTLAHCIIPAIRFRAAFQAIGRTTKLVVWKICSNVQQQKGPVMAVADEEPKAVVLRSQDNVAVAARPIPRGFVLTPAPL